MNRRQFLKSFAAGTGGLLVGYPLLIERYLVEVNRYRIAVPNLPPAFEGFSIVHLTDLHYGFYAPLDLYRQVVARANRLARDIIVCTGDYVHWKRFKEAIDQVWPVLCGLKAPLGVYSVLGNHDCWAGMKHAIHWIEKSGQNLRHRVHCLQRGGQRLWLAGSGDLYADYVSLDKILQKIPGEDCRIVLAHNPDTADVRCEARIDLMISGHTHGGQVVFPFLGSPYLPVTNKVYTSGLKKSKEGRLVFISRGIGCSHLPIRINCYPEIAVLELVRQV